jgi:hypothetical protein
MELPPPENSYSVKVSGGLGEGAFDGILLISGDKAENKSR